MKSSSGRLTAEHIQKDPGFQMLDRLPYDHVLEFASEYFRKSNLSIRFYLIMVAVFFLGLPVSVYLGIMIKHYHLVSLLQQFLYGLLISFTAIIPMHEIIHGIVYFLLGARNIRFGVKLRQFAFYAVAEDFVTTRAAFYALALAPFIILSGLTLLGFFYIRGYAGYTYLSILFWHSTMCAGDFALLSYYEVHKDKEIYSFDDVKNRVSYFYYRKQD